MSRIVSIETIPIQLKPFRRSVMRGQTSMNHVRVLLLARTDDGVEGWGEATPIALWGGMRGRYSGETVATVTHVVHDVLAPGLLGGEVGSPARLAAAMDAAIVGNSYAKAALEMAYQDVRGKIHELPLCELLGGSVRPGTVIAHMLGILPDEDAVRESSEVVAADGITAFQVKGGEDPVRDARLIAALRAELGPEAFLRLDANQGYGMIPKRAADAVRRLEAAGVDAVEQPAASKEALAACVRAVGIPIVADEGCWTAADVLELWSIGGADAVSVYVAKAGGVAAAKSVADTALHVGFSCDVNGSLETGIGTAASLQVAQASPAATLPSVVPIPAGLTESGGRYFAEDVVADGMSYGEGSLRLSGQPGLGVDVDHDRVEHLAIDGRRQSLLTGR